MKASCFILSVCLLLVSCSGLPPLDSLNEPAVSALHSQCMAIFPEGRWQFVHLVEVRMPDNKPMHFMTANVVSTTDRHLQCVIMTLEGLVLFSARLDPDLKVERAVSPFTNPDIAGNLMGNVQMIFFKPGSLPVEVGLLESGAHACRFAGKNKTITDIVPLPNNRWEIRQYSRDCDLIQTLKTAGLKKVGSDNQFVVPETIEVRFEDFPDVSMKMNIVEAVQLETVNSE